MSMTGPDSSKGTFGRTVGVLAVVVIAVSLIGFFVGTRTMPELELPDPKPGEAVRPPGVQVAPSYGEIRKEESLTGGEATSDLARLAPVTPHPDEKLDKPTQEQTEAALAERAERRAFSGAPPVIPHPIPPRGSLDCQACHGEGLVGEDLDARAMSHPPYSSCTQCHAPSVDTLPEGAKALPFTMASNSFQGMSAPTGGQRAWQGAPPTVPHTTHMRSNCGSCHGPAGERGLQTTHPFRRNCVQCHGRSAELSQRRNLSVWTPQQLPLATEGMRDEQ